MSLMDKILQSSLFKSAFVYGLASAFNGALPFLLLPVLTRYLTPDDYGMVTIFTTLISFFNVFIGLNVHGAVFNKYFFYKENKDLNFGEYISSALIILFSAGAAVLLLTLLAANHLVSIIELPSSWIIIACTTPIFQYFILIQLAIYQASQNAKSYAKLLIFQSFLNVCLSLLFVISFAYGWHGRVMGIMSALYITGFISLILLCRKFSIKPNFRKEHITNILKFGVPLVPHTLGAILISLADRFIITHVATVKDAGLYQAGLQVSMIIMFFTESFNKAYSPWLYSSLQKKSAELNVKIVRFTYLYFVGILLVAALINFIPEKLLVYVLGTKFLESQNYILWSSFAYAFNGMYLMVCNYIFYSEQTKYLAFITLPAGLINIGLSYYLTSKIGVIGASISMAISYALMFLLTWHRSAKLVQMPWLEALKFKK